MAEQEYEKILFQFYNNVLDEVTIETIWAVIVDKEKGLYKLDSIPFYASDVAANDIIYAEFDEYQEQLTCRHTVEASGNSTVQVVILDSGNDTNEIREVFDLLGCSSERYSERYFVIDVPGSLNYAVVQDKLTELQNVGISIMQSPIYLKSTGWSKL